MLLHSTNDILEFFSHHILDIVVQMRGYRGELNWNSIKYSTKNLEKGQLHFFQRHACCLAMLRNSEFDRRVVPGYGCLDRSEQTHFVEV